MARDSSTLPIAFPAYPTGSAGTIDSLIERCDVAHPRARTLVVAVDGDSRAADTGNGNVFIAQLNAQAALMYGHAPRTVFLHSDNFGGGQPYALWLATGGRATGDAYSNWTNASSGLGPRVPPGKVVYAAGNDYGFLWTLQADGYSLSPNTFCSNGSWWNTSIPYYIDVYLCTRPAGDGATRWNYLVRRNNDTPKIAYTGGTTIANVTVEDASLISNTFSIKKVRLGPFSPGGDKYQSVTIKSAQAGKYVECWGIEFVSSKPGGVVFTSFSAGGYKLTDLSASHSLCGDLLQLVNPDAVLIRLLYNDPYAGVSLETMRTNLRRKVEEYDNRYYLRPDIPIFVEITHTSVQSDAQQNAVFDAMCGMVADECERNPRLRLLNTLRMTTMLGLNRTSQAFTGLVDKGTWDSNSASYDVGDYVETGANSMGGLSWHPCITAHTSSATNGPCGGTSASHANWGPPVHSFMQTEADGSHPGAIATWIMAGCLLNAMGFRVPSAIGART